MQKKNHMEFKSKLNAAGVEGNKSDKQVSATKKYYKILQLARRDY